jgi:WhiB family redox-sensing transcriptional regulator
MSMLFNRTPGRRGISIRKLPADSWKREAACKDVKDTSIFFPVGITDEHTPEALAICRACPVRVECLNYALAIITTEGIWGGTNQRQREAIRRRRYRMSRGSARL